ncbi:MAG: protein kinase [Elusimicrobia bacterium]|nr:protein kinase [Elusimicrobiota bacterium]
MRRLFTTLLALLAVGAFAATGSAVAPPAAETPPQTPPADDPVQEFEMMALGLWAVADMPPGGGGAENGGTGGEVPASAPILAPAIPPGGAAPTGLRFQLTQILEDTRRRITSTPPAEQRAVAVAGALNTVTILTQPPPSGIDPGIYDAVRNRMSGYLARQGSDDNPRPYEAAIELSERVLARDPNDRDALNNTASSQYGLGRYKEAAETATRLTKDHEDERAYTTRALANYQMKRFAQAYEDSQIALRLNPKNQTAFEISKLSQPRMTTAADLGLDAAQRRAAEQVSRDYQADLDERGRVEAAAAKAVPAAADPSVDGLRRQAAGKFKMGDYQGAKRTWDLIIARQPGDPEALESRASAANLSGDYEEAVADAGTALRQRPDSAPALMTRARALSALERHEEALVDLDRAASLRPKDPKVYIARAGVKEALTDLAGMRDDFARAVQLGGRYDAELRRASQRYGLKFDADPEQAAPPPARRPARRALLAGLISVTGGLLLAFGLFHVGVGSDRRTLFSRLAGASPETAKALAAAGGLGAGYEVLRTLGHGGMGVVYEARDKALERRVAVKKMRDEIRLDPRERARFLQEARIVAQLHHPNIVEIHTIVSEGDDLYLVFEFVEGHTIEQILARKGRLSVPEAQWVLHGVAKALDYAHRHGVVHRDLKPSNIMLEKDGAVKVMDFGIARQAKDLMARSTMTGTVAGTPQYMAPEQEEGVVRPESDVFSMGAMLYEMVTGSRPYPGAATTASKVNKSYQKPSLLAADLPTALESLIEDCLEPDPERRPRSAAEFRARLDALRLPDPVKSA